MHTAIQDTELRFPVQPRTDAANGHAIQVGNERLFHASIYVWPYVVDSGLGILYESTPRTDEDLPHFRELIPTDRLDHDPFVRPSVGKRPGQIPDDLDPHQLP